MSSSRTTEENEKKRDSLLLKVTAAGFFGLNLYSSVRANAISRAISEDKPDIDSIASDSYKDSRNIGLATCGMLALPVVIAFWNSLKNLKNLKSRAQEFCTHKDFFAGLSLQMFSAGLFAASFYESGSENQQDALACGAAGLAALGVGSLFVNNHYARNEPEAKEEEQAYLINPSAPLEGAQGSYQPASQPGAAANRFG